jgi:membrane-associated phospholipid phosphatase
LNGALLRKFAWLFVLFLVLELACYFFIDRKVEIYVAAHQYYRPLFQIMAAPSLLPLPIAVVYLASYAMSASFVWPPGRYARRLLAVSIAVLAATAAKDELKWDFGRYWPQYLSQGMYGFTPFSDSYYAGGFPSGHTAYIAAPMLTLCWLWPKYRVLWVGIVLVVMFGLVAAGYHYVGDVIAGFFVGWATAWGTIAGLRLSGWGEAKS